jgi:hypothetical protein
VTPVTPIYTLTYDASTNVTPITASISATDLTYNSAYDATLTEGITINGNDFEQEFNILSSLTSEESGRNNDD